MKLRDRKITFNISALILFVIIMLPNIVWFIVPSPNDILRAESTTPILDVFATVAQVMTIAALCIIKNSTAKKLDVTAFIILSLVFCLMYYICWVLYYLNTVNAFVIIGLSVFPCAAFAAYAVDRKNYIALFPTGLFAVLHLASSVINFI